MSDQFDEQAEKLLPCEWVTRQCQPDKEEPCATCYRRPAVAAALRESYIAGLEQAATISRSTNKGAVNKYIYRR